MIETAWRKIKGELTVSVAGRGAARFINLCIRSGIHVRDVQSVSDTQMTFRMKLEDLPDLKPFVRKTHVKLHIDGRRGLPFFLWRYHARKVIVLVTVLAVAATVWLSSRVWRIEVVGNSSIGEDVLLKYLKEHSVACGTAKTAIDNDALELALRQDFDAVIWASVYTKGTKLTVCVQEKIATDRPEEAGSLCTDLVAGRDAEIISIVTRSGKAEVAAGDSVKAGDVLVSGRQEILDDNGEVKEYYYQSADADIMGRVVYDYEDWIPEVQTDVRATGETHSRYCFTFGTLQLALPNLYAEFDQYEQVEEKIQLCIMDSFYLPVWFSRIRCIEQETVEQKLTVSDAKTAALQNFNQFLANLEENGVAILDKNVMIEKTGSRYHVYGKVSASENIAEPALTDILPQPSAAQEEKTDELE